MDLYLINSEFEKQANLHKNIAKNHTIDMDSFENSYQIYYENKDNFDFSVMIANESIFVCNEAEKEYISWLK